VQDLESSPALSLYELNSIVRQTLELTLMDSFWVVAEIAEMREPPNGHCYLELVEKDERRSGEFRAKAHANVWNSTWQRLKIRFERETRQHLHKGLKIMARVNVSFHEVYGYSLNIIDLNSEFTLGELARRRQEIVNQLMEDGIFTLNKEIPVPRLAKRIAVISSENAAGYGDFCNQIEQSPYAFVLQLFPAQMQGANVPQSVIAALDSIAEQLDQWDAVVIIRGGGATTDLDGFEDYELASNVAQFPLPVITGIGHERDETVVDLVAGTRCKTPTAVAAFLIERMQTEDHHLLQIETALHSGTLRALQAKQRTFELLAHRYSVGATEFVAAQRQRVFRQANRLQTAAVQQLADCAHRTAQIAQRLAPAAERMLERATHRLLVAEKSIQAADPKRILRMGYSITYTLDGKTVRSEEQIPADTLIETHLAKGIVRSRVVAPQ
jgi:exodeoxyribonuclease VII, large subunit